MKKLMTACAACVLAGMVSAQVESVNIVGYQTINLPQGYKMATSTFVPVGSDGTALRLGDMIPSNFDGDSGDTVQFFSPVNGATISTYTYYDGYGWYDPDTDSNVDDVMIPAGTGMFVSASQDGAQFMVSGEVALGSLQVVVGAYAAVGNSSPVAITLGDVVPSNFDGDSGDTIQFFSPVNGATVNTFTYYDGYGWYDPDTDSNVDEFVLNPGDAFFASSTQVGTAFTFPPLVLN